MRVKSYFFCVSLFFLSISASAQDVFSTFYVVIGGFKSEENAQKFSTYAHEQNLPAVYAFNDERQLFYVYVRATQTREVADEILNNLRSSTVFRDAWVFNGVLSGSNLMARKQRPVIEVKPDPAPQEKTQDPVPEEKIAEPVAKEPQDTPSGSVPSENQAQVDAPKPIGKPFVFKLVNRETGSPLNGLVRLQEADKAAQFRGFNGNEKVYVPAPSNRSGKWYVVCQVLGFRQYKKPVVYDKAGEVEGASVGTDNEIIIPLQLTRVRRGDYIEMENVKFFNNTALFTPGSERELDELVAMMEENPDYQVKLHGHTNGNQARDIVSIGNSTNFFNPDITNAKTHGSAKELALLRAELVKTYLVSKGIDASRVTSKGEGGTQMLVDPKGTLAGLNDRVEVEIRKH
jgi:outer membrane protein OmpA-like peptidoglycan-associated protein